MYHPLQARHDLYNNRQHNTTQHYNLLPVSHLSAPSVNTERRERKRPTKEQTNDSLTIGEGRIYV